MFPIRNIHISDSIAVLCKRYHFKWTYSPNPKIGKSACRFSENNSNSIATSAKLTWLLVFYSAAMGSLLTWPLISLWTTKFLGSHERLNANAFIWHEEFLWKLQQLGTQTIKKVCEDLNDAIFTFAPWTLGHRIRTENWKNFPLPTADISQSQHTSTSRFSLSRVVRYTWNARILIFFTPQKAAHIHTVQNHTKFVHVRSPNILFSPNF